MYTSLSRAAVSKESYRVEKADDTDQTYTSNTNLFRTFDAYKCKVDKQTKVGVWSHWMAAYSSSKDDLPHVSVADQGPIMLGVLDRWTQTVNISQKNGPLLYFFENVNGR